ncbi:hypothetical protein PV11_01114 [Exophiala sideris]|uniref:Uncharacterized protein n=1 Tax=Exophiala sideris TaxID=1016849 RepID=A0A0D1ZF83_9EURO|nr:hypothetical protein PV11_01114 [Exophiala sideris]
MALLPGQEYGEPRWIPDLKDAPGTHSDTHPALRTNVSYEERRAAMYNAKDANESHPDLYSKSSFLIN